MEYTDFQHIGIQKRQFRYLEILSIVTIVVFVVFADVHSEVPKKFGRYQCPSCSGVVNNVRDMIALQAQVQKEAR